MTFLNSLFRRKRLPTADDSVKVNSPSSDRAGPLAHPPQSEGADIADNPLAFSAWIFENIVQIATDDHARILCATPEEAEKLSITEDEQRAAANEFVLMYVLGSCMFSGIYFPLRDHQVFKKEMAVLLSKRLFGGHIPSRIVEVESAIDSYLEDLIDLTARDKLFDRFSEKYFDRVYPGNLNSASMRYGAAIARLPLSTAFEAFKLTQDGYCRLKHGMPYKSWVAIEEVLSTLNKSEERAN